MTATANGVRFSASGYWTANTARARWFDAVSLLLPAGEALIIESMVEAGERLSIDCELAEQIGRLCREESAHQRAHARYNAALALIGLPVDELLAQAARVTAGVRAWPLPRRLMLCAALEQCTAWLSMEILRSRAWLVESPDPAARMWRWHCEEELGHHQVALDLAASLPRRRWQWPAALLTAACWIALDIAHSMRLMQAADRRAGRASRWQTWRDRGRFAVDIAPGLGRIAWRLLCSARQGLPPRPTAAWR